MLKIDLSVPDGFWPEGVTGAVCLTFDDGLQTQLDNALPCLDDNGLKGTFYLNPGLDDAWGRQIPAWQRASRNGHEIGNHTSQHPCSRNFGFRSDGYCLENLTLSDIEKTIDEAEEALNGLFPEQGGVRSFCYPCYETYVGAGANRQSYVPLVARRFMVARGHGFRPNRPQMIELSYVQSWAVGGTSGDEMIAYVSEIAEKGLWGVICVHGVGGEHRPIETRALQKLARFLSRNRQRVWSDTMLNIAKYIHNRRATLASES